jgi:DNA-binding PadR family transcriptional regulator
MEDEGHLTSVVEQGKRIYTITAAGQQWLEEQGRDSATQMGGRRGGRGHEERSALRQRMMALMGGVQQVARHGTSEQIQEALAALDTATRQIYATLAGGRTDRVRDDGDR